MKRWMYLVDWMAFGIVAVSVMAILTKVGESAITWAEAVLRISGAVILAASFWLVLFGVGFTVASIRRAIDGRQVAKPRNTSEGNHDHPQRP